MIRTIHQPPFEEFNLALGRATNTNEIEERKHTKLKSVIGAAIGTALPIGVMMKTRKIKNPLKLEYSLKDMLVLSGSSVGCGMIGGMINESQNAKKHKFKEGTFQFLNAVLPTVLVAGSLKLCEKQKQLNNNSFKILSVALGIITGMFCALKLSNFIFDPKDEEPDRKLSPKDCLASADEAVGALALAKFPIIKSLNLDKSLPLIYGYCGYRAGKVN